jgi:hypothetical protein
VFIVTGKGNIFRVAELSPMYIHRKKRKEAMVDGGFYIHVLEPPTLSGIGIVSHHFRRQPLCRKTCLQAKSNILSAFPVSTGGNMSCDDMIVIHPGKELSFQPVTC